MTTTVPVLCTEAPDVQAFVAALAAVGADVLVDDPVPGYVTVADPQGVVLLHAETPSLIHVPGEARRLLDRDEPPVPYWWLNLHVPAAAPPSALELARQVAARLSA